MSFVAMRNCQPSTSSAPARPANSAADQHHLDVVAPGADAAVLGGVGVEADRAHLVAGHRAVEQDPEESRDGERDEDADVQALQLRVAPEHRQPRALRARRRRPGSSRCVVALQRAAERRTGRRRRRPPIQLSMIVEITSLAPVRRLQQAGDARPQPAGEQRRRAIASTTCRSAGVPSRRGADVDRGERADEVLALAADVEQAGAERERDRQAGEDQRRGQDQRLLQVQRGERPVVARDPREQPVQAGAVEDRLVGVDRVGAGRQHDEAADEEGEQRGDERDDERRRRAGSPPAARRR